MKIKIFLPPSVQPRASRTVNLGGLTGIKKRSFIDKVKKIYLEQKGPVKVLVERDLWLFILSSEAESIKMDVPVTEHVASPSEAQLR